MPEPHASLQRRLLQTENVEFDGGVVDMKSYGWSPTRGKSKARKTKRKKSKAAAH